MSKKVKNELLEMDIHQLADEITSLKNLLLEVNARLYFLQRNVLDKIEQEQELEV